MVLLCSVSPNRFNLYEPSLSLRSSDKLLLVVLKTSLKLRGDQTFAVAAPKLWNKLPLHLRHCLCLNRCLKANSFRSLWHSLTCCLSLSFLFPNCSYLWFYFFLYIHFNVFVLCSWFTSFDVFFCAAWLPMLLLLMLQNYTWIGYKGQLPIFALALQT